MGVYSAKFAQPPPYGKIAQQKAKFTSIAAAKFTSIAAAAAAAAPQYEWSLIFTGKNFIIQS